MTASGTAWPASWVVWRHFIFMPVCTGPGRLVAAAVCVDRETSPDRAAVHGQTAAIVTRFFDRVFASR